jgi:pimeloyl-ACP methyl ester carboxylesterase
LLAEHARLFAVDLPGFGAPERREILLSPRAMGEFVARLMAEADLGAPHVVAPDVRTVAALFAAAAHPDRIGSLIVGTGGARFRSSPCRGQTVRDQALGTEPRVAAAATFRSRQSATASLGPRSQACPSTLR